MSATLDGQPIAVESNVGWGDVAGIVPQRVLIEFDLAVALELERGASLHGSVLKLGGLAHFGLTILGVGASPAHPGLALVDVADRRWVLHRTPFKRGWNVPRVGVGVMRLPGVPVGVAPIVPDRDYHPWSLGGRTRLYTGRNVLEDAMNVAFGRDGWDLTLPNLPLIEVRDLDLEGNADQCLAAVLSYFGRGLQVGIRRDGRAYVYATDDKVAAPVSVKPPLAGGGLARKRSRALECPSHVDVYYPRIMDVRANYNESNAQDVLETSERGRARSCRAFWVLRLPEDATIAGQDYVAASWCLGLAYLDYVEAQRAASAQHAVMPALTRETLRTGYLSPTIMSYGTWQLDPSGLWLARVNELHETFRGTYRVDPAWAGAFRGALNPAKRVAVLNPEGGEQGPGAVYQDFCVWIAARWGDANTLDDDMRVLRNVYATRGTRDTAGIPAVGGSPGGIVSSYLTDLAPAPADIRWLDPTNLIFELRWRTDWTRQVARLIRSALSPSTIPTDKPTDANLWLAFGDLAADHEASFVFAVLVGAPNGLGALYRDTVRPADVGVSASSCRGPPLALFERDPYRIARHGWDDAREPEVRQALLVDDGDLGDLQTALGRPLNYGQLRENSRARAAAVYYRYASSYVGVEETDLNPDATLRGRIASVIHRAGPGGLTTTTEYPLEPPHRDPDTFLSPAARRALRRIPEQ